MLLSCLAVLLVCECVNVLYNLIKVTMGWSARYGTENVLSPSLRLTTICSHTRSQTKGKKRIRFIN